MTTDDLVKKWGASMGNGFTDKELRTDLISWLEGLMLSDEEILEMVTGNIPWAIKPQRKAKTQLINPFTSGYAFAEVIRILSENLSKELRSRILETVKDEFTLTKDVKCGKCNMLGDAAPCDECYRKGKQ